MYYKQWVNRQGNECYVRMSYHPKRWFILFGADFRNSGSQTYISVGLLCFTVVYSVYNGMSPYSASILRSK